MAYFEQTKISDAAGNVINPAKEPDQYTNSPPENVEAPAVRTAQGSVDDHLILLRRMVKLMESQAAVDTAQRQRMTVDAITAGLTLAAVTAVTTVTTVSSVTNQVALAGYDQRLFSDFARTAYNTGIRAGLTFS